MFFGEHFVPDLMEKDLGPWDLYKGVKEDSVIHFLELVMSHHHV